MSQILAILLLLSLPSCGFLLSPPALAIEEQIVEIIIEEAEKEIHSLEK